MDTKLKSTEDELEEWKLKYKEKNEKLNAKIEEDNNDKHKIEELESLIKDQKIKINDLEIALKF